MQGLLVTDADGAVLHCRALEAQLVADGLAFAARHSLSLTAYLGDRILCERRDEQTDRLIFYKEPTPEAVGGRGRGRRAAAVVTCWARSTWPAAGALYATHTALLAFLQGRCSRLLASLTFSSSSSWPRSHASHRCGTGASREAWPLGAAPRPLLPLMLPHTASHAAAT